MGSKENSSFNAPKKSREPSLQLLLLKAMVKAKQKSLKTESPPTLMDKAKRELTIANFVSLVVRPGLIIAATKVDIEKHPNVFAALWVAAILSDGLDGLIAKYIEDGGSPGGPIADILGDRLVEQIGLRHLKKIKMIPGFIPDLFLAKGLAQDTKRVTETWLGSDEHKHILAIGDANSKIKPENRIDRLLYGTEKAGIGVAASRSRPLALVALAITTIHGLRRAKPAIMDPENLKLPGRVIRKIQTDRNNKRAV